MRSPEYPRSLEEIAEGLTIEWYGFNQESSRHLPRILNDILRGGAVHGVIVGNKIFLNDLMVRVRVKAAKGPVDKNAPCKSFWVKQNQRDRNNENKGLYCGFKQSPDDSPLNKVLNVELSNSDIENLEQLIFNKVIKEVKSAMELDKRWNKSK